jgi:hypothetical protein
MILMAGGCGGGSPTNTSGRVSECMAKNAITVVFRILQDEYACGLNTEFLVLEHSLNI